MSESGASSPSSRLETWLTSPEYSILHVPISIQAEAQTTVPDHPLLYESAAREDYRKAIVDKLGIDIEQIRKINRDKSDGWR